VSVGLHRTNRNIGNVVTQYLIHAQYHRELFKKTRVGVFCISAIN